MRRLFLFCATCLTLLGCGQGGGPDEQSLMRLSLCCGASSQPDAPPNKLVNQHPLDRRHLVETHHLAGKLYLQGRRKPADC